MAANTDDSRSTTSRLRTIEDYGLIREATAYDPEDTAFMDLYFILSSSPYSSPASVPVLVPEWKAFKIIQPPPTSVTTEKTTEEEEEEDEEPRILSMYAVSPTHHAYVTLYVKLTTTTLDEDEGQDEDEDAGINPTPTTTLDKDEGQDKNQYQDGRGNKRLTTMRYRDMIADNYISAFPPTRGPGQQQHLRTLRWLAISRILNPSARRTFVDVFRRAGKDILTRGRVEVFVFPTLPKSTAQDTTTLSTPTNSNSTHSPPHINYNNHNNKNDNDNNNTSSPSMSEFDDPFTAGVFSFLRQHKEELGHAFARRFIFLSEGRDSARGLSLNDDDDKTEPAVEVGMKMNMEMLELRLDLVVELARSSDSDSDSEG